MHEHQRHDNTNEAGKSLQHNWDPRSVPGISNGRSQVTGQAKILERCTINDSASKHSERHRHQYPILKSHIVTQNSNKDTKRHIFFQRPHNPHLLEAILLSVTLPYLWTHIQHRHDSLPMMALWKYRSLFIPSKSTD